jgi:class 3 adenylate cyclase
MVGIGSALLLISFMAWGLLRRNAEIRKNQKIIEEERDRSEKLLLNILPADTAEELKKYGKVKARKFENVTVLFTDFVNFTNHSQNLSPEEIVESVDYYFSKFDEIIERHGLEKIKTIGDAYMCVGGLPFQSPDSAINTAKAALEIAQFVKKEQSDKNSTHARFHIRMGMSTGTVVAGVVGTKKFVYDIWGDTVNIASRMESQSEPEKINISEYTYHQIKGHFDCAFRGELEVKNKGLMKMYFVNPN